MNFVYSAASFRAGVCLAALALLTLQDSRAALGLPQSSGQPKQAAPVTDDTTAHRAVMTRYCVTCHNSQATTPATASGVVLDRADLNHVADNPMLWERVIRKLRTGSMPPEGAPRPDRATQDALAGFIESRLDKA